MGLLLPACGGTGRQLRKAKSYYEDGRYTSAARVYEDLLERKPQEERAILGAARAWSLAGEADLAITRAEQARALGLDGADAALARAYIEVGRGAEARALLAGASGPDVAVLQAEAHLAAGDFTAALDALRDVGNRAPDLALRGWIRWRAGGDAACEAATADARDAAAIAYEDPWVQADAAAVFRFCDDADAAEDAARTARTFHLGGSDRFKEAAARRQAGGDNEGMVRQLAQAVTLYPDEGLIHRDLGVGWLEVDEPALAAAELQRALVLPPYDQDLQEHAIVVSTRAYDASVLQPMVRDTWLALHVALAGVGDAANATAALERSLLQAPDATASDWSGLARAWSKVGRHQQAEAAARRALQLDGTDPMVWLTLADVRWHAGAAMEAAGFARRAWELDVGSPAIAIRLAEADLQVGDADEAQRVLETAIKHLRGAVHPLSGQLHSLLAQANAALGN